MGDSEKEDHARRSASLTKPRRLRASTRPPPFQPPEIRKCVFYFGSVLVDNRKPQHASLARTAEAEREGGQGAGKAEGEQGEQAVGFPR